jgi:hypothetical protein
MIGVRRTKQLRNTESQLVTILLRNLALDLDIGLDGKKTTISMEKSGHAGDKQNRSLT